MKDKLHTNLGNIIYIYEVLKKYSDVEHILSVKDIMKYVKEEFDEEIIKEGIKQVQNLNEKYKSDKEEMSIFNFIYRNRTWNEKEGAYLGWERKRGMLTQFNEYLLGNIEDPFRTNTISHNFTDDFSDDFPGDFPNRGRVSKCEKFPL